MECNGRIVDDYFKHSTMPYTTATLPRPPELIPPELNIIEHGILAWLHVDPDGEMHAQDKGQGVVSAAVGCGLVQTRRGRVWLRKWTWTWTWTWT